MNDNGRPPVVPHRLTVDETMWTEELRALRDVAVRGVAEPESLTAEEIKEMSWAFLLAAGSLKEVSPQAW